MDQYDTSQLTEFPRFEPESSQSGVSTFFNKLWKFPIFSPSEAGENNQNKAIGDGKEVSPQNEDVNKQEYDDKPEQASYAVEFEGRSLQNVLRRISSLVALGSSSGTKYSDTELARYWMPDDISRECYECAARFGTLRRRHHCRVCGQVFCGRCCSQRVPGQIFGCAGGLRVCNYCCNVVLSYLRENEAGEISPDLRSLQESLQAKFPDNKANAKTRDNYMFAREEERGGAREPLPELLPALRSSLPLLQHRYRLVRYNGVWRGSDVMQWLMDKTGHKTRAQARAVCQALVSGGWLTGVPEPAAVFADYALYRPAPAPPDNARESVDEEHPHPRLAESASSYCLALDLGESSARLTRTPRPSAPETKSSPSSEEETPNLEQSEDPSEGLCPRVAAAGLEHLQRLLRQGLCAEALGAAWLHVLLPLCVAAADATMPDMHSSDIDIRNYVQVKKLPDGHMRDSCLVPGVVLTKNVAHRGMPQEIENPTVLLLDCSIAYQRVEGKLTSLEPVLLQEREYLVRCAARITALRPHVVLVRGAVARPVQDALRGADVALAAGVGARALQRVARSVRADLVASVDARIAIPRLGSCKRFAVTSYPSKTLMSLEGCAEPALGCCILLRGASTAELARVKRVVRFMLRACYNWKLEKAFLADVEAMLPDPGAFDDDVDENQPKDDNQCQEDAEVFATGDNLFAGVNSDDKTIDDGDDMLANQDKVPTDKGTKNSIVSFADDKVLANDKTMNKDSAAANKVIISDGNTTAPEKAKNTDDKMSTVKDNTGNKELASYDKVIVNDENIPRLDDKILATDDKISTVKDITNKDSACDDKLNTEENIPPSDDKVIDDKTASEVSDPLQTKFSRSESERASGVPIRDFSDPLRAAVDDDVFLAEDSLQADTHADRWSTDDTVLSMSPNVIIPPPYLDTEAGRRCPLRRYLPRPALPARPRPRPPPPPTPRPARRRSRPRHSVMDLKERHPFVTQPITTKADDPALKASLAHYRATGCQLGDQHTPECPMYKPSVVKRIAPSGSGSGSVPDSPEPPTEERDPLSPEHHQQLSVLLYSYSSKSANVPDFCVNPWIVTMEMYGRNDITLGAFLDKYCFNSDSKCPSGGCSVPVNQHVRRFVHGDACLTVTCNVIQHSAVDTRKDEHSKQVMFWSRCEQCGASGRARRLSRAALCLSLAMYLRVRATAARQVARACRHPLHAHAHVFARHTAAACCRYMKITPYEIELPPDVISTHYDTKAMRDALIAQLNELVLKGHETLSAVAGAGAEQDYQAFKHHTELISLALTRAKHDATAAGVIRSLWRASDALIAGERMLRDAQDAWASPPPRPTKPVDATVEEKSDLEESTGESENSGTTYVFAEGPREPRDEKDHPAGGEEDEEKGDKKTVRQILSQLLSNKEASHQNGIIISHGLVPVVVQIGEVGSVIAAALASVTYHRSLRLQRHSTQSEADEAEVGTGKDRVDGDKSKAKSNDHIEVLLKDGLLCRIYYAPQFHRLRHALLASLDDLEQPRAEDARCCDDLKDKDKSLCDIEEGFIRSLAHCVPWAAKGGKSGSTFCKTKDDRYVLKEMTKPEWNQFLEFAPHYFNYVTSCRSQQLPSLLARIVGVYSVGGAGNGVLVMENVWYRRAGTRFDLKGSSRHRLAAPAPLAVLLDENLLQLRWQQQLFVASHTGRVLFSCIDRDTEFLASNSVMDYSLLLGIDGQKLVLGIIDYIRTFTWDKKLEHLVKKNLGSGQPTVVSPDEYKSRFRTAARKYFLRAPAPWDHLL
ncbi:putative 1-phosphatidylinositol 3-phosphate 5-kinase [Cydia pomonella]|uniref:putative 1-phosphatidylinositol 3-phosphate 5-kinase n=1 Tax=Cydia pomonella TaxID=82600 RepID=UPI002ADE0733|nr:putative 1-phosphatidylinositol 3-phosphate 5-kinase [Cydia pomonella]